MMQKKINIDNKEGKELPDIKVNFPDGSTFEFDNESWIKALLMKCDDQEHLKETLKEFVISTVDHWEEKTVPTKFNWDNSWEEYVIEKSEFPEPREIGREAMEEVNYKERLREVLPDDVPIPHTYHDIDPEDDTFRPITAYEAGDTYDPSAFDDTDIEEIQFPEDIDQAEVVEVEIKRWEGGEKEPEKFLVLESDVYEKWEELMLEKTEKEIELNEEYESNLYWEDPFDNQAELASEVLYYYIRAPLMGLVMQEMNDEDGEAPKVHAIQDDGSIVEYPKEEEDEA